MDDNFQCIIENDTIVLLANYSSIDKAIPV